MKKTRSNVIDALQMGENNFSDWDLTKADLSGLNFGWNANFRGAFLRGCNFRESVLVGADFSGADMAGVDFRFANLVGAVFAGSDAQRADFRGAAIEQISLPLGRGIAGWQIDSNQAAMIAAHICAIVSEDETFQAAQAILWEIAKNRTDDVIELGLVRDPNEEEDI